MTLEPNPVAYTQADLATVRAARLRGVRIVQFADRSVTYTSDAEMKSVEDDIKRSLASAPAARRNKQMFGVASKGF